ncbi:hypothetical protein TVAGG3_0006410 [Trichomonas vaginalis G3]|uniref:hypothetical protein n=2 Tax=Trichomonas vaginalis (strain ATCC PRA-98 / G3) TaxID=412133 RepID=UPI0021E57A91|nr:hypothetical protein TVAGG3_0006410 [Trichomonas vaginalis G3]KAI5538928.1 hypothetical protein TVAGG3_0006410 [Trichomonas vaginalis G3]
MLFYLQSTDPNEYGTVKLQTNLGLQNEALAFRVVDFNTIASFVITDETDFIEIEIDDKRSFITFPNRAEYRIDKIAGVIDTLINEETIDNIDVELSSEGTLKFSSKKEFKITRMSHRVQLLLGAYHMTFPLKSVDKTIEMKSVPYVCYGNCLYIESKIANVTGISGVNSKGSVEYKSFCYAVNSMFIPNVPVIATHLGKWVRISPHNLKDMQFRLVDFQGEPVELKAPVRMTVEVDFLENIKCNSLQENSELKI